MQQLLLIVTCHLIGDYILQTDFLAKTKGNNWYHLFIHCFLYCVPFVYAFGYNSLIIGILFITHFITDAGKARYNLISYPTDQLIHYIVAIICFG